MTDVKDEQTSLINQSTVAADISELKTNLAEDGSSDSDSISPHSTLITGRSKLDAPNFHAALEIEDPANLVRQARRVRPNAALVSTAEIVDVGVIAIFGGVISGVSVALVASLMPGGCDLASAIGCGLAAAIIGIPLFALSAIIPIFFPIALLLLQMASGLTAGPIVLDALCGWLGVNALLYPVFSTLSGAWLTLVLSILPIFACPLYFALTLSSKWQTSIGWSMVGLMVCNQDGLKPTFAQAFKRTILRLWWPIMFPGKMINAGLIDDWVEERSKTVLVLKPQNLKAELIKAKDHVAKSKDRVVIAAHTALLQVRSRGSSLTPATQSPQALRKLLRTDWQSVILRTECYFVLMLTLLFTARCAAAYWTQVYFFGFHHLMANSVLSALAQHPYIAQATPLFGLLVYLSLFFLARVVRPQILEMTSKGFKVSPGASKSLHKWEDLISVQLLEGTSTTGDEKWMVFSLRNQEPVKLRLDIIRSTASKEEILNSLERWAPHAPRDPELIQTLQPPIDHSYTDIWLEALTAPPKRDKLKPLVCGATLKDNQYKVVRTIAVGGQGSVYLASDCLADEEIVLKEFVLPVFVDLSVRRRAIERFEQEAKLLKGISHDQIVKLLDFFVEDHRAYLVLEHLEGQNLRQMVQSSGPTAEASLIKLALQMCEILNYLESQNPPVVHRDFTPDNLILGKDGVLRLIDFNVAQVLDHAATTTGTVVGKPSYLAPEQFRGEPSILSDIYSFGATLSFMLTAADPLPICASHPAQMTPNITPGMDLIVATCTNYDASLRYQSAGEIERSLITLGTDQPSMSSS